MDHHEKTWAVMQEGGRAQLILRTYKYGIGGFQNESSRDVRLLWRRLGQRVQNIETGRDGILRS